jgi:hypothetical protein
VAVDFDLFYEWAADRFGEHNLKVRHTAHGVEITTHSFFALDKLGKEDRKFHLWMNTEGGKKKIENGAYRCWLTDEMGSLVTLVSKVDAVPFEEAEQLITGTTSLRALEKKVDEFFGHKETVFQMEIEDFIEITDVVLPDFSFNIDGMSPSNRWKRNARNYLAERKIPTDGLFVCTQGDHENRIIIPYYDRDGKLVFYNGRTMSPNKKIIRYMKPPEGDQESVLYMTSWPAPGSKIYIMEGEFDALALALCDLVGCACGGKYLSDTQIELIRGYEPVLVFDSDESGLEALTNVGNTLLELGFPKIRYVRPPKIYKDWNKLLIERNTQTVKAYIERFEKPYTTMTGDLLLSARL